MRVGQRLFLAVLPAIVGLLSVAALAYFGEYARQAPEWLVALAIVASIVSAVIAWRNTHYVAQRIEQLAGRRGESAGEAGLIQRATTLLGASLRPHPGGEGATDELDRIEHLVRELEHALASERTAQAARERALHERAREYTTLVDDAVSSAIHRMDEVRLPLHILLENRFGELNENQEEMLGAARAAAEASDESLRRLRDVVRVDLGLLRLRQERVRLQEVMESLAPALRSAAEDRGVTLDIDLSPDLPALSADRGRLQEALSNLLLHAIRHANEGATVTVRVAHDRQVVQLTVRDGAADARDGALALADRLVVAHAGSVERRDGELRIRLPVPPGAHAPRPGDAERGATASTR
jgi:signal transduction histidine kinase